MENSVTKFEQLLNSKSTGKNARKTSIYNSKPIKQSTYRPQDVLDTVFSQIKCIQQADNVKNSKSKVTEKKSGFLAVDNKPVYKEVPKQQKFDTQCVTDTQLINIIENVEAINAHKGITQEFDNTFIHTNINDEVTTIKTNKETTSEVNEDRTAIRIEDIENTNAIDKESFADVFIPKHTEEDKKSIEKPTESVLPNKINIDNYINSQCQDDNMAHSVHCQSLIEINTANINNNNVQNKRNDIVNVLTQGHIERDKDTASKTSSDNSPSVLADINICVLDEQLNTEDIANIHAFEKYNTVSEFKIDDLEKYNTVPDSQLNNQKKPAENINLSKESFTEDQLQINEGVEIERERTPSPVLNMKPKKTKRTKTPDSFSVPLDVFENFEKTVMSFVENKDKQILINSQILGNELCLNLNTNSKVNDAVLSPIIELSSDELHISQKEIEDQINRQTTKTDYINEHKINSITQESFLNDGEINIHDDNKTTVTTITEKRSDSLKDEILFSSDEENECTYNEILDLPLTCALETSFYDEPDVLEKTMYVGFQTASNKSIQIQTESFEKARSMLSNDREFSLTELVEMCDDSAKNKDLRPQKDPVLKTEPKSQSKELKHTKVVENEVKTIETTDKQSDFLGFQTANNKKINISKKAMSKISNVFKDIDLTENFLDSKGKIDSKIPKNNEVLNNNDNRTDFDKKSTNIQDDNNINDDLLIQEFENIEMSLEEKEANEITTNFEGFKTASNKKIQISDKAILKTNNVFKDINLTELNENVNNPIYNVSREIKAYSNNSKTAENVDYKKCCGELAFPSTNKATFEGFKTANNKIIEISDAALSKTKNIFKDINDPEVVDPEVNNAKYKKCKNFYINSNNQKFEGFKTASNKSVLISKESIIKSKKIFQDLDVVNDDYNNTESTKNAEKTEDVEKVQTEISQKQVKDNHQKKTDIPVFQGFKTASNKPVNVSENSLAKSRKMFEDIDPIIDSFNAGKNINITSKDTSVLEGFQAANNKPVVVSEKNLIKSRKIFAELHEMNSNADIKMDTIIKQPYPTNFKDESLTCKGFTTANNKLIKISEESLTKSKNIFRDINNEMNAIENEPYTKTNKFDNTVFKGFQTANKKPINISEEALLRSKKIFQDIEQNTLENMKIDSNTKDVAKTSPFVGFKTGNNKEVLISEAALEKTKKIFDDLKDYISDEPMTKRNKVEFTGFQTASNKNVNISKEAIEKTKNIFKDINIDKNDTIKDISQDIATENDDNNCNIQKQTTVSKLNIFTTASNKNITISEKALKKSKELLTDSINFDLKNLESEQTLKESINIEPRTTNTSINIDNILNTQVLHNFEHNLCTEDFQDTPKAPKRSTSPILSCPRAKKRKFETPYKPVKQNTEIIKKAQPAELKTIHFDENYKKNKVIQLKDLETVKNTIDPYITNFNLDNIHNFEFSTERNDITDTKMTINDIKDIFQDGVDTKIIPEGWFDIHIKLIIWKLLSYEVKYNFMCTVRNVLNQLKYRYDRELYKAERPALRKIMEKDDVPSKTLVLCVAGIFLDGVSVQSANTIDNIELLLTDGWYFIKAIIDKMLSRLVYEKKIYIGCKIVTNGAELLNCEQGVSPWEDISQIRLKIFGNSTRPAAWDTKLGYHNSTILNNLTSVKLDGGKISKIQVYVTRVYPLLYVEKFEDGSTVTRSERLEHLHQIKYENEREAILEQIYEEVQKEFSDQVMNTDKSGTRGRGGRSRGPAEALHSNTVDRFSSTYIEGRCNVFSRPS